jgi:hypothetical protein
MLPDSPCHSQAWSWLGLTAACALAVSILEPVAAGRTKCPADEDVYWGETEVTQETCSDCADNDANGKTDCEEPTCQEWCQDRQHTHPDPDEQTPYEDPNDGFRSHNPQESTRLLEDNKFLARLVAPDDYMTTRPYFRSCKESKPPPAAISKVSCTTSTPSSSDWISRALLWNTCQYL